jgi:hypothetical protein
MFMGWRDVEAADTEGMEALLWLTLSLPKWTISESAGPAMQEVKQILETLPLPSPGDQPHTYMTRTCLSTAVTHLPCCPAPAQLPGVGSEERGALPPAH